MFFVAFVLCHSLVQWVEWSSIIHLNDGKSNIEVASNFQSIFKELWMMFEWCLNVLLRWTHFFIGQGEKCSCFILDYLQREKYKNFLRFWSIKFWRWKACSLVLDRKGLPSWLVPWPVEPVDQSLNQFTYFGSKTCHFSIHLTSNT